MGILFSCPQCVRPLNVGDEFAGRPGLCPNCRQTIAVPRSSEIAQQEFRHRLEEWTRRQQPPTTQPQAESTAMSAAHGKTPLPMSLPPLVTGHAGVPSPTPLSEPERNQPEMDAVTQIATESQQVAKALSAKFSASSPASSHDSDHLVWFVRPAAGGQFGPASGKLLQQWMTEGRVTGDSYVWCQGWDDWQLAAEVFPAVSGTFSADAMAEGNSDQLTATRTRTAYIQARQRRTMRNLVGLLVGTVVVIVLMVILWIVVRNRVA